MILRLVLFLALILGLTPLAHSKAETWIVRGNGKLPPMAYLEGEVKKGFGYEIVKTILDSAGISHDIRLVPWNRAFELSKRGNGMVFGMFWTAERAKLFDYTDPLWTEDIVLVTKRGSEFPFETLEDLQSKNIGLQLGAKFGQEFENAVATHLFTPVSDYDPVSRLNKIFDGVLDAGIFNPGEAALYWNARLAGLDPKDFSILPTPIAQVTKHIGIAKTLNRKSLIVQINTAIEKTIQERSNIMNFMSRN